MNNAITLCISFVAVTLTTKASSQAFDMYYDGFENRPTNQRPDDYYTEPGYDWLHVRESVGGVTPYSGKKMLELRSDPRAGRGITVGNVALSSATYPYRGKFPKTRCSFMAQITEPLIDKDLVFFVDAGTTIRFDVNSISGIWKCQSNGIGNSLPNFIAGVTPVPMNKWFRFAVELIWTAAGQGATISLDGVNLGKVSIHGQTTPEYVNNFAVGISNRTERSDQYLFPDNPAPGIFLDDYSVTAVPEPSSMGTMLAVSGLALASMRSRQKRGE